MVAFQRVENAADGAREPERFLTEACDLPGWRALCFFNAFTFTLFLFATMLAIAETVFPELFHAVFFVRIGLLQRKTHRVRRSRQLVIANVDDKLMSRRLRRLRRLQWPALYDFNAIAG